MALEIKVPELSESVADATVAEWTKNVGDAVKAGDVLVILETDKVSVEVTAEADGVLADISAPAGTDVKAKQVIGSLDSSGAPAAAPEAKPAAPAQVEQPKAAAAPVPSEAKPAAASATPVAQRVAAVHNVDVAQVPAAGGKVTKADVQNYMAAQNAPAKPALQPSSVSKANFTVDIAAGRREERIRLSRRRQTIAKRLVEAQATAALLTTFNEVDMSAVMAIRAKRKDSFQKKHGVGLGFNSFFVKAVIGALKAFPVVNAEMQGNELLMKHYYDIGIAIGSEEGLVVPVLRDADKLSFAGIEQQIKDYAGQVKEGSLPLEALMGGTFTITNGGVFGSMMSTPILNPPQVAILGLHAIKERPVVVDGQIVIRPMMYTALTYDHRVIDGREAVQFLVKIKELIEDPENLLIEG
ncbi:MAG: 2-oxoglutarate dehydrogenase complex dihydrolipoyllysine-residue succinyltransferase [Anaerolineae bacterium]|jgi:2-oxoglutarate dehydrogenase E2 component (dihydrolipoamide succinyltransferase)|nr:2-oxoglutarate dehydrogenase complex dihydrolipoyllysine-residue succinyltransferase [Anaerolineae bacterium]